MIKKKYGGALCLVIVLLWMMLIFSLSAQPYESQDLKPWLRTIVTLERIPQYLYHVNLKYGGHIVSIKALGLTGFVEFFIRKSAHLTEYFILGVLLFVALRIILPKTWGISLITISLCYLYALSDEYHQSFVSDRTPLFADVLLDTGGAALGIMLYILINKGSRLLFRGLSKMM